MSGHPGWLNKRSDFTSQWHFVQTSPGSILHALSGTGTRRINATDVYLITGPPGRVPPQDLPYVHTQGICQSARPSSWTKAAWGTCRCQHEHNFLKDVHSETVDGSTRNDMHIHLPLPIGSMTRSKTMHGPVLSKVVSQHCRTVQVAIRCANPRS